MAQLMDEGPPNEISRLYRAVYVLIVVAVVGGVNFLANRYNKTYDTTANKQFTLSDQTIKIAKNLKQPVTITYWDQPTKFQAAHDLLDRYKNLSPKIDVQYMDADKKAHAGHRGGREDARHHFRRRRRQAAGSESADRRRSHRRDGARAQGRRAHRLLRARVRASTRSTTRIATDTRASRICSKRTTTRRKPSSCWRSPKFPPGLHHRWWSAVRSAITSSPKWTRSRTTSKTAAARCSCWIRR